MQRTPNELLSRLFEYAEESLKELDPSRFQLSSAVNECFNPGFLQNLPGLSFDLQMPGDNIWLKIERLEEIRSPAPDEGPYTSVFKLSDNPGKHPVIVEQNLSQLIQQQLNQQSESNPADTDSHVREQAKDALAEYLVKWQAWADVEKPRRQTIGLYGDLFAMMQQMETGKAARELVWGLGVSSWLLTIEDKQHAFQYPLLTQALEIGLNESTMALEIRPRATEPQCEMDAFINASISGANECERAIREHIAKRSETPVNPFMPSTFMDLLKLTARSLDSRGRYLELMNTGTSFPEAGETLLVSDSWVVFARPKPSNWLINDLRNIREQLKDCEHIPAGPLALVTPPSTIPVNYEDVNFRGLSSRSMDGTTAEPKELYFPLPYNEEQVTIVQRLERAAGVAVQGPPGTGKTHTIANIICHYLANGKRILVTSRGEQALKVLQSKIPLEVRPLTVALLTSDREGIRQFQGSIEAIQHQVSQINPSMAREHIQRLHEAIDRTHTELVRLDRRVNEIAHEQLTEIQLDGVRYRAEELAQFVMKGGDQHAWFDDELSLEPQHALPLSNEEGVVLREARRRLSRDLAYVNSSVPDPDALLAAEDIGKLHGGLCRLRAIDQALDRGDVPTLIADTPVVMEAARELDLQLETACKLLETLQEQDGGEPDWSQQLRRKATGSHYATEINVLRDILEDARALVERRALILENHVEFPNEALECGKTREAITRAAQTGKPFGLMSFGASEAKAYLTKVRVNGTAPGSTAEWGTVMSYIQLHASAQSFTTRWNPIAQILEIPRLEGGIQHLRQLQLVTGAAGAALALAAELAERLPALCSDVFEQAPERLDRMTLAELKVIRGHLAHYLTRLELAASMASMADLQQKIAGHGGPVTGELRNFLTEHLGNPDHDSLKVCSRYTELVAELRRVLSLNPIIEQVRDAASRLKGAGGDKIAHRMLTIPVENGADDTVFPTTWKEAWQWARMRTHLENIEARHELVELNEKRTHLESGLAKMYRDVVSKAAWLSTKKNASPMVLQALAGYSTAIRKIGQGTGPNAERYRRDAQHCMQDAAGAIPCWIMSHSKISESMPAEIGSFDLVIVDEASQSDLWALPAIVRAKKVLVVGDDKQVSPDGGFKSSKRIGELRNRFLNDQPFGAEMTPEKSLYDLAARVFAGEMVMLREHFRCVPPIITYSNRFYNGAIQPLRIPRQSERLDPPLVDIYVKDGVRNKKGCNKLEAEAIAGEINTLIQDERYAGRSIGVVSLLGFEQAKYIDSLVRERCPASELVSRDFACGDASTFQGSERDIIFISMVADPEQCHPLSGVSAEQRFNVAASRARDRMYLVRSVTLEDLSLKDLRRTLVEYFSKPLVEQEVDQEGLIKLCESGFEKDVFSKLVERGYRVIPQVKSGAYRLDMVVEGANDNRLAIECDGDAFHGPDRWAADMNRQRVLERAGWTFWRCFASSWSMHKDEIFEELVERLAAMGIEPIGALKCLPTLVEYREWIGLTEELEEDELEVSVAEPVAFSGDNGYDMHSHVIKEFEL